MHSMRLCTRGFRLSEEKERGKSGKGRQNPSQHGRDVIFGEIDIIVGREKKEGVGEIGVDGRARTTAERMIALR